MKLMNKEWKEYKAEFMGSWEPTKWTKLDEISKPVSPKVQPEVATNIRKYNFPFQVDTLGLKNVARVLIGLYNKAFDKTNKLLLLRYLQFWGEDRNNNYKYWQGITHCEHIFDPNDLPVISIEEAVDRLQNQIYKRKGLLLNKETNNI